MTSLLFITDSLGIPRLVPEPVYAEQVWPHLVERAQPKGVACFQYSRGGYHTDTAVSELSNHLGAYRPDLVVLQIGIVDCAPRALRESEQKAISRLPTRIRELVLAQVRKHYRWLTLRRGITYVPHQRFCQNLEKIKQHYANAKFLIVPIGPATQSYCAKNPGIARNIALYNQAFTECFGQDAILDQAFAVEDLDELFLSDNHHLSPSGHGRVSSAVLTGLERLRGIL